MITLIKGLEEIYLSGSTPVTLEASCNYITKRMEFSVHMFGASNVLSYDLLEAILFNHNLSQVLKQSNSVLKIVNKADRELIFEGIRKLALEIKETKQKA